MILQAKGLVSKEEPKTEFSAEKAETIKEQVVEEINSKKAKQEETKAKKKTTKKDKE